MRALTGLLIFVVSVSQVMANGPREEAAANVLTGMAKGRPSIGGWWFDGGDIHTAAGIVATAADVAAITNRADILALVAAQDAPALALAAEVASLESDLTNVVQQALGVMPPYSPAMQTNYRTIMRNQMKQARAGVKGAADLDAVKREQEKLNDRQHILNLIRELKALDPNWDLSNLQ